MGNSTMGAVIYEDTRQQIKPVDKHAEKHRWFAAHGIEVIRKTLNFGDYASDASNRCIDTKRNVDEVAQNINGKNHDRFKREALRAAAAGYRLVILVENDEGIISVDDLKTWTNTHCRKCVHFLKSECAPSDCSVKCMKHGTRKPIQGERLAKAMHTMSERYGMRFMFCTPQNAAWTICSLLGIDYQTLCEDCFRYENGFCKAAYNMTLIEGPGQPVDGSKNMCDEGVPF